MGFANGQAENIVNRVTEYIFIVVVSNYIAYLWKYARYRITYAHDVPSDWFMILRQANRRHRRWIDADTRLGENKPK